MFIVDGTEDLPGTLKRLARLMYNMERNAKVYEWGPGSDSEPAQDPAPGFLTLTVPGATAGAPPLAVDYRPSVGFIYYYPGAELDLRALADRLQGGLEDLPSEHLLGYLPVEAAPHVTLLHRGRTHPNAEKVGPRNPYTKGWYPAEAYPSRVFHVIGERTEIDAPPSHVSYRGGFTWYIAPVTLATNIQTFESFEEFNAIVAGIVLDTGIGGKESEKPVYALTPQFFGISPLPSALAEVRAFAEGGSVGLVLTPEGFEAVPRRLRSMLPQWSPEKSELALPDTLMKFVANLTDPRLERVCGHCEAPLWGTVFALRDPLIEPYLLALCRWCIGCLRPSTGGPRFRIESGVTRAQAYRNTPYECLLPLLEAKAQLVEGRFVVELAEGEKFILESPETYSEIAPPCLRIPALRELRLPSLGSFWLASAE